MTFPLNHSGLYTEKQGWRYLRIQQNGKNASGQTHYLSLSGLEVYGRVTGIAEEFGKDSPITPTLSNQQQHQLEKSQAQNLSTGRRLL